MTLLIAIISSFSNILTAIVGMYRYKRLDKAYRIFLLLVVLGLLNELISWTFISIKQSSTVNNNVYVLFEALLICLFFKRLQLFNNAKVYWFVSASIVSIWVVETFVRNIREPGTYFRICYSFMIVLLSIGMVNRLLLNAQHRLWKNSTFIICIAYIIFYTLNTIVNTFWLYGLVKSEEFILRIHTIIIFINIIINLLFALAILWIPKKQPSILPY